MAQISITVDGVGQQVEADQRPTHLFAENKEVVVCRVNGALKDLWTELAEGDVLGDDFNVDEELEATANAGLDLQPAGLGDRPLSGPDDLDGTEETQETGA